MSAAIAEKVPLPQAAQRLGRRYRSTLDLVLLGHLQGEQDPHTRRWYVDPGSLAAYAAQKAGGSPP